MIVVETPRVKPIRILNEIPKIYYALKDARIHVQRIYRKEIDSTRRTNRIDGFIAKLDSENKNVVLLNYIVDGIVIRHCTIKVDLAFLFPLMDQDSKKLLSKGFKYDYLKQLNWENYLFKFNSKRISNYPNNRPGNIPINIPEPFLFNNITLEEINLSNNQIITDDFGKIWNESYKIKSLSTCQIPSRYLIKYNLVGTYYYAKYTKSGELDCVLFAEDDNPHDPNAIKVLRWLPQNRDKDKVNTSNIFFSLRRFVHKNNSSNIGNNFFDLGYISRKENSDLHKFMVENNSRILFAKCHDSQLELKGGINYIKENNIYYPSCLLNIKIHE